MAKAFKSAPLHTIAQQAVRKCLSKLQKVGAVAAQMINAPVFAVPVALFIRKEVENSSLEKVRAERLLVKLGKPVNGKKIWEEYGNSTKKMDFIRTTILLDGYIR